MDILSNIKPSYILLMVVLNWHCTGIQHKKISCTPNHEHLKVERPKKFSISNSYLKKIEDHAQNTIFRKFKFLYNTFNYNNMVT